MTEFERATVAVALAVAAAGLAVGPAVAGAGAAADASATTQQECAFPVTVTDATGSEVTVEERPERIVVLQPSDAQVAWEVGIEDRVVGYPGPRYTAYLNDTAGTATITNDDGSVNVERVVGLEPDLVVAADVTPDETVSALRRSGLTVYNFDGADSIEEIVAHVNETGRVAGACEGAAAAARETTERVDAIERAVANRDRPRVLYYFFQYTTGNGTHIHDVIETAGGRNLAAAANVTGYRPVNAETVAVRDPEWIVRPTGSEFPSGAPYDGTTAYRQNNTLTLDRDLINQPGPRVVEPLSRLARAFHPEAFADGEPVTPTPTGTVTAAEPTPAPSETTTGTLTDVSTPTPTPTGEAGSTPTPTEGAGPGFGAGAVVAAALLAGGLLARRAS